MAYRNNKEIVEAWARGWPGGGNQRQTLRYNETGVLFSYAEPIARRIRDDLCLVTDRKWSVTASKHTSMALNALPGRCKIVRVYNVMTDYVETVTDGS